MSYPRINSDRSERVMYNRADSPVYVKFGRLSNLPNYRAESHWHDDIELIAVQSGRMQYNVNGEIISLETGEGIFVNAKQLHFGFSEGKQDCEFICILLHPVLLCSSMMIEQKYVTPLLANESIPFCRLTSEKAWEERLISLIREIYDAREDVLFELKVRRAFLDIWIALCENTLSVPPVKVRADRDRHLSALKDMISFISENYAEKLSLGEIAASGKVGKTACCGIFKKYVGKTPGEYLTELRLRKAMELLAGTDMTILEISCAVGFSGASYFTETFGRFYDVTPSRYRENARLSLSR